MPRNVLPCPPPTSCPWPPALCRARWDMLAEPTGHRRPSPVRPRYPGWASVASRFPAHLGALHSQITSGRMEAGERLSICRPCPNPGARASPLPPPLSHSAPGHREGMAGGPAGPGPVVISLEPTSLAPWATVFLHFANWERATQVAQGGPGEQQSSWPGQNLPHVGDPSEPSTQPPPSRSLAGIRDPVRRELVPLAEHPQNAARQPVGEAGQLHLGLGGGEGVLAGR